MARSVNKIPRKISIQYDENEREKKLKEIKAFSFSDIWNLFYDESGDDEVNSIKNFIKYLQAEADAIRRAHYPEDNMHAKNYEENPPKERRRGASRRFVRKKYSPVAQEFFKAEDEYFKNHEASYIEYIAEKKEAEKIADEQERNAKNQELNEKYKDAIAAFQKCETTYVDFEKYETTINFLSILPASLLYNIRDFQQKCEERGRLDLFDKGMRDVEIIYE